MKILFWKHGTSKDAFRQRYIESAQKEFPHLRYETDGEYGVAIHGADKYKVVNIWLERGYEELSKSPKNADEILSRWIAMLRETVNADNSIDLDAIVPVIKPAKWPEQQRTIQRELNGSDVVMDYWVEPYNSELTIMYSQWRTGFWYPSRQAFAATGKTFDELRIIAMDNLRRRATGRMITGTEGLYLVSVGGNVDTSLILLDEIWRDARLRFDGNPLVALPDRSTFIACDSADVSQVYRAAVSALDLCRSEQYPVSPFLFVRKGDRFEHFDDKAEDDEHPIPNLDVVDIHARKKGGGSTLSMLIASPLHADARSAYRLARKLDTYIQFMSAAEIVTECGTPTPTNTEINVVIHGASDQAMLDLLSGLEDVVARHGAKLVVSKRASFTD
jgi:hypothetical protein